MLIGIDIRWDALLSVLTRGGSIWSARLEGMLCFGLGLRTIVCIDVCVCVFVGVGFWGELMGLCGRLPQMWARMDVPFSSNIGPQRWPGNYPGEGPLTPAGPHNPLFLAL